jgi:hypothetical protein
VREWRRRWRKLKRGASVEEKEEEEEDWRREAV